MKRWLISSLAVGACLATLRVPSGLASGAAATDSRPVGGAVLPVTADLQLWLRADAGVERSADKVLTWQDQSGRGNHARAADETAPRWRRRGLNGRPAVCFDGARSFMAVAHHPGLNADRGLSVFCVYRFTDGFRIAQKKDRSSGMSPDAWFLSPGPGLGVCGRYSKRPFFFRRGVYLHASIYDPADGRIRIFSNGEPVGEVTDVPGCKPNTDPLYLGKRHHPGGTEGHLHGQIAELLVYNAPLSDADRQRVETYLRSRHGIVGYGREPLRITRVIPGHRQVTVEWLAPETTVPQAELRYTVQVKLRSASWDQAVATTVPATRMAATIGGLLDHADYAVRVLAERSSPPGRVAASAERLVSPSVVPGVVIDYVHKDETHFLSKGVYIGSPSLARLPDGRLVAGHDLFGCGSWDFSRIFRSPDGGRSWRHVADLQQAFWGKLFVHRGKLFMLACRCRFGDILLYHSPDGGETWRGPAVLVAGPYHKAPVPLVEHRGRLWTCVERRFPEFQAVALSVPLEVDLMNPHNWTVSTPLPYDPNWAPTGWKPRRAHISEGNAVVDPQGRLLNVLRYNPPPHYRKAVVLNIAPDGRSLSFNRTIDFYGSLTKFTIRRHPETGVYWSLVNRVPEPEGDVWAVRNVLTLVSSRDLDHWTPVRDVLRDDREIAPKYTGFQYIDWLFDGADLIFVSRTAYNGAHNFHDANHLTFHRIKDFADGPRRLGP